VYSTQQLGTVMAGMLTGWSDSGHDETHGGMRTGWSDSGHDETHGGERSEVLDLRTGTVRQNGQQSGYIESDVPGEDFYTVTRSGCAAFGHVIPPPGTRVIFSATKNEVGFPIAQEVMKEDQDWTGTVHKDNGKFGFIQLDTGGEMFVMPIACREIGGAIPPLGTRVLFKVVIDSKTCKPRADKVRHMDGADDIMASVAGSSFNLPKGSGGEAPRKAAATPAPGLEGQQFTGTVAKLQLSFGFIQQDEGDEMFFMPKGCTGFGGVMPQIGTRVSYEVVTDAKTGRPRAEKVCPAGPAGPAGDIDSAANLLGAEASSIFGTDSSSIFSPEVSTAIDDLLNGKPQSLGLGRAAAALTGGGGGGLVKPLVLQAKEQVGLASSSAFFDMPSALVQPMMLPVQKAVDHLAAETIVPTAVPTGKTGAIERICGNFGFIQQDSGEDKMFVMPGACLAFGGSIPPVGTRVEYEVVTDSKTGKPRAEDVRPQAGVDPNAGRRSGVIQKSNGQFGFIQQDSGEEPMFVLPFACGGQIPDPGTRVTYGVVMDSKTGRPRAENVQIVQGGLPGAGLLLDGLLDGLLRGGGFSGGGFSGAGLQAMLAPAASASAASGVGAVGAEGREYAGVVVQAGATYGFIQPDVGGEKMFVLPGSCVECCDSGIPPPGTRVIYSVVQDRKTGKPRAEGVRLEASLREQQRTGVVRSNNGKFGFIDQDNGEDSMFVMPAACAAFGGAIPEPGTRVAYGVVLDSKTGKPRAEDVKPAGSAGRAATDDDLITGMLLGTTSNGFGAAQRAQQAARPHPYS